MMHTYTVIYLGNDSNLRIFEKRVNANSEREAVVGVYKSIMAGNYFPQEDGTILDCDGFEIASTGDTTIEYDGGYFSAEIEEDEEEA